MRVYHFLNAEYGLAAVENQQIKISRINLLNDPFEYLQFEAENHAVRLLQKHRKTEANKLYGVLCFTRNYSSPVLWAHYADKHQGLCLGFDIPDEMLLPIEYIEERHPSTVFRNALDKSNHEFLEFMLTKKHKHWAYEQEYRLIHRFGGKKKHDELCFTPFGPEMQLKEIVLGYRFSLDRAAVKRAQKLGDFSGPVKKVMPSRTRFEMV